MHTQPAQQAAAAAAVAKTKHNPTMQLPYKDEEDVNL
jgi:hypothetical protein